MTKYSLNGWDDGRIFFGPTIEHLNIHFAEISIDDYPELMDKLIEDCKEYFIEKGLIEDD